MAIIPLRAYNREIEGLIENNQLDEAVAHCRHILATFPKHIASYRLLGKAHLEQQRISDATDIFLRVLSAIPDDFLANVGMSIIREDENNLDASIWHMELAYEAQPANVAIQDELRRLYGRRDGMQPPKVRLTRGALARMYSKGGLYEQAIGELKAAIAEDPNRPDLQQLLAQLFFQASQRMDAVETAANVVKKLPFCLVANQILAVSLPDAEHSDATRNYQQTAVSMDPYFAFASPDAINSDQVPENAVNIEKLEWKSGIKVGEPVQQPTWATSLGIKIDKPTEEGLPDWLQGEENPPTAPQTTPAESAQTSVSPFIWDTQEVEKIITDTPKPEAEFPDWMKDAGWTPVSGDATATPDQPVEVAPQSGLPPDAQLEKAEVPDWLQGIAPDGVFSEEAPPAQTTGKDSSLPWLEKQTPGPTDSIIQWLEDNKPVTQAEPAETTIGNSTLSDEEVPDWLKDLDLPASEQPSEPPSSLEAVSSLPGSSAFTEQPAAIVPDTTAEAAQDVSASQVELPVASEAQVSSLNNTLSDILPASATEPAAGEEPPDWLKEMAAEPEGTPAAEELELPVVEPSTPAAQPEVAEAPIPSTPIQEQAPAEIPAALEPALPPELSKVSQTSPIEQLPVSGEDSKSFAALDEVHTEQPVDTQASPAPAEEQTQPSVDFVPSSIEPVSQSEASAPLPDVDVPDWIKGLGEPDEAVPTLQEPGEVVLTLQEPEEVVPTLQEPEVAIPAAREVEQPAVAESAIPKAEDVPAWMLELEQTEAEKDTSASTPEALPEALEWKEEELPDWLKEIAGTPAAEPAEMQGNIPAAGGTPAPWQPEVEELKVDDQLAKEPAVSEPAVDSGTPQTPVESLISEVTLPPAGLEITGEPTVLEAAAEPAVTEAPIEPVGAEISARAAEVELAAEPATTQLPAEPAVAEPPSLPPAVELTAEPSLEENLMETRPLTPRPEAAVEIPSWVPEVEALVHSAASEPSAAAPVAEPAPSGVQATPVEAEVTPVVEPEPAWQSISPAERQVSDLTGVTPVEQPALLVEPVDFPASLESAWLANARAALDQGQPEKAAESYASLIDQNASLDEVVKDLQEAIYRFPVNVNLWVSLGDAHFRSDQLKEALDAYTKAEELVR